MAQGHSRLVWTRPHVGLSSQGLRPGQPANEGGCPVTTRLVGASRPPFLLKQNKFQTDVFSVYLMHIFVPLCMYLHFFMRP